MNRNILLGLIIVVLVVGGFVLVQNNSKTEAPATTTTQTPTTEPEAMEKAPETDSDAPEKAMEKEATTVTLSDSGFSPKSVSVKVGDTVVWKNSSGGPTTVDSAQHPTHLVYPKLNLGNFNDGEEHKLVFDKAGKYSYHDHLNPSRFGTVVVE